MKMTLLGMSAVAALAAAAPATAQYGGSYSGQYDQRNGQQYDQRYGQQYDQRYGQQYDQRYGQQYGQDVSFDARISNLETRLSAGLRAGTIDRREAWSLRRELSQLRQLNAQYSMNGMTQYERQDLQQRLRSLREEMRTADNGSYDRYDRTAWGNDYYGGAGQYTGTGGPYEEAVVCERRGGVSGVVDALTGNQNCYSVGSRVGNDLYAVPYQYRDQYRDGRGVYYRSDGQNIYEIDARTNTVISIHRAPR
jgi:hypothetical protein